MYSSCLHSEHSWLYDIYLLGPFEKVKVNVESENRKSETNRQSSLGFLNNMTHWTTKKVPFNKCSLHGNINRECPPTKNIGELN